MRLEEREAQSVSLEQDANLNNKMQMMFYLTQCWKLTPDEASEKSAGYDLLIERCESRYTALTAGCFGMRQNQRNCYAHTNKDLMKL